MFVIGFNGASGVGKTTLAANVVRELTRRGWKVAAVKGSHHEVNPDSPGKDTWLYAQAGAREVALACPHHLAIFAATEEQEPIDAVLSRLKDVDLVVVEGYRFSGTFPRLWVRRRGFAEPLSAQITPYLAAVVDDGEGAVPNGVPRLTLSHYEEVADFIEKLASHKE